MGRARPTRSTARRIPHRGSGAGSLRRFPSRNASESHDERDAPHSTSIAPHHRGDFTRSFLLRFLSLRIEMTNSETARCEAQADVDGTHDPRATVLVQRGDSETGPQQATNDTQHPASAPRTLRFTNRNVEPHARQSDAQAHRGRDLRSGVRDRFTVSILRLDSRRLAERQSVSTEPIHQRRVAGQVSDASEIPRSRDLRDQCSLARLLHQVRHGATRSVLVHEYGCPAAAHLVVVGEDSSLSVGS